MRVRISYSAELDEVPEEVIRLLEKASVNASDVRDMLESMIDMLGNNLLNADWAKSEISRLRDLLTKIDYCLNDSDSILQGYFSAIVPPTQEDTIVPPTQEDTIVPPTQEDDDVE